MLKKSLVVALVAVCFAGTAAADIICPDSSYCVVNITSKDRVTIAPNGAGETFAATGITIRVYLRNCNGAPLVGVPRQEIVSYNSGLCICPGGNVADAATDVNGMAAFSGTIRGGGCVVNLTIFADGIDAVGPINVIYRPNMVILSKCSMPCGVTHMISNLKSLSNWCFLR